MGPDAYYRCARCGQPMSDVDLANCMTWTNYGRPDDMEPPEPCVAHRGCWLKTPAHTRAIYENHTWHPPRRFNMVTLEPIKDTEESDD